MWDKSHSRVITSTALTALTAFTALTALNAINSLNVLAAQPPSRCTARRLPTVLQSLVRGLGGAWTTLAPPHLLPTIRYPRRHWGCCCERCCGTWRWHVTERTKRTQRMNKQKWKQPRVASEKQKDSQTMQCHCPIPLPSQPSSLNHTGACVYTYASTLISEVPGTNGTTLGVNPFGVPFGTTLGVPSSAVAPWAVAPLLKELDAGVLGVGVLGFGVLGFSEFLGTSHVVSSMRCRVVW